MGSEQVLPVFLLAQAVSVIAGAAFAVVLTVPTTRTARRQRLRVRRDMPTSRQSAPGSMSLRPAVSSTT